MILFAAELLEKRTRKRTIVASCVGCIMPRRAHSNKCHPNKEALLVNGPVFKWKVPDPIRDVNSTRGWDPEPKGQVGAGMMGISEILSDTVG